MQAITDYLRAHKYGHTCPYIARALNLDADEVTAAVKQGVQSGIYTTKRGWCGGPLDDLRKTILLREHWT